MSKKIIGLVTPTPTDSTSLYRVWGPFSQLAHEVDLVMLHPTETKWAAMASCDIIFVHRPNIDEHFSLIKLASEMGKFVWVDFDDDLYNIDPSNPSYEHYAKERIIQGLTDALKYATHITVSTEAIQHSLRLRGFDAQIIKNELPIHLMKESLLYDIPYNNKVICWRGTQHHIMNIVEFKADFAKLAEAGLPFIFMGFRPYPIREHFQPGQLMEMVGMNQWQYFQRLKNLRAAVHVVPLKVNQFNQSKSNIAYQEALIFAGSLCVVPNLPEWNELSGVVIYERPDFVDKVKQAWGMSDKARMSLVKIARRQLLNSLREGTGAKARLEIISRS